MFKIVTGIVEVFSLMGAMLSFHFFMREEGDKWFFLGIFWLIVFVLFLKTELSKKKDK